MVFFMLTSMTMTSYASWHWSSPWEVCGTEVIKKGEKCNFKTKEKEHEIQENINKYEDDSKQICKSDFQIIKKVTTSGVYCVKESSYDKLILRGWGI